MNQNTFSALTQVSFRTPEGALVQVDASGMNTKVRVTQGAASRLFDLVGIRQSGNGYVLIAKTGDNVTVDEASGQQVLALQSANAKRQKQLKVVIPIALGSFGFLALIIVIIALAGGGTNESAGIQTTSDQSVSATVSVAKADEAITGIDHVNQTLVVRITAQPLFQDTDIFDQLALSVQKIGAAVQAGADDAKGMETVNLVVSVPTTDRLGNEETSHVMTLVFSADDFRQAKWQNLSIEGSLNLVNEGVFGPAAGNAAVKWCRQNDALHIGLCRAVLK